MLESNITSCMDGGVGTANDPVAIEIKVEVGFKGLCCRGIGIDPVLAAHMVPVVIEIPGVESIGGSVFPEDCVDAIDLSGGKCFPAGVDALMNLSSLTAGDGN